MSLFKFLDERVQKLKFFVKKNKIRVIKLFVTNFFV